MLLLGSCHRQHLGKSAILRWRISCFSGLNSITTYSLSQTACGNQASADSSRSSPAIVAYEASSSKASKAESKLLIFPSFFSLKRVVVFVPILPLSPRSGEGLHLCTAICSQLDNENGIHELSKMLLPVLHANRTEDLFLQFCIRQK
jgi:hypothetical protein